MKAFQIMRRRVSMLVFGPWLALACQTAPQPTAPEPSDTPSIETRWILPEPADQVGWLSAPARVLRDPNASFAVSVPLGARVLKVRVRPGQQVRQNEPLVDVLIPELLKAAGALAAANLRVNGYATRRARLLPLLEQGLVRAGELSELEANLASAQAERESARATLRIAGVGDAQAAGLLAQGGALSLRAPMAAMVVQVSARPGEMREPAAGPLVELAAPESGQVEARLAFAPAHGATFSWVSELGSVPLILEAVSPRAADDGTRSAWFHVSMPAAAPPAGSLGRVRMDLAPNLVAVPTAALREQGGKHAVVVRSGREGRLQSVEVILRSSSEAIVSGLSVGTPIAANAQASAEVTP